jgi:hypothetical protein
MRSVVFLFWLLALGLFPGQIAFGVRGASSERFMRPSEGLYYAEIRTRYVAVHGPDEEVETQQATFVSSGERIDVRRSRQLAGDPGTIPEWASFFWVDRSEPALLFHGSSIDGQWHCSAIELSDRARMASAVGIASSHVLDGIVPCTLDLSWTELLATFPELSRRATDAGETLWAASNGSSVTLIVDEHGRLRAAAATLIPADIARRLGIDLQLLMPTVIQGLDIYVDSIGYGDCDSDIATTCVVSVYMRIEDQPERRSVSFVHRHQVENARGNMSDLAFDMLNLRPLEPGTVATRKGALPFEMTAEGWRLSAMGIESGNEVDLAISEWRARTPSPSRLRDAAEAGFGVPRLNCAIEAAYAFIRALRLTGTDYLSMCTALAGKEGRVPSVGDVAEAMSSMGVPCEPIDNLSVNDLIRLQMPAILIFYDRRNDDEIAHAVTLLEVIQDSRGLGFVLFLPSDQFWTSGVHVISEADLRLSWRGAAVVQSPGRSRGGWLIPFSIANCAIMASLGGWCIVRRGRGSSGTPGVRRAWGVALLSASVLGSVVVATMRSSATSRTSDSSSPRTICRSPWSHTTERVLAASPTASAPARPGELTYRVDWTADVCRKSATQQLMGVRRDAVFDVSHLPAELQQVAIDYWRSLGGFDPSWDVVRLAGGLE